LHFKLKPIPQYCLGDRADLAHEMHSGGRRRAGFAAMRHQGAASLLRL